MSLGAASQLQKHVYFMLEQQWLQAGSRFQHSMPSSSSWGDARNQQIEERHDFYDTTIEHYASLPLRMISLSDILKQGLHYHAQTNIEESILKSANATRQELPRRLARKMLDLQFLPHLMITNPHVRQVYNDYFQAFETLRDTPEITSMAENREFTAILENLLAQHGPMIDSLAIGLKECRQRRGMSEHVRLDHFLDGMLQARITRRIIAEQHISMASLKPNYIGIVDTALHVRTVIERAAERARQVCLETYGRAPEVKISGDVETEMPYIYQHMDYILYEVLKNSLRAVVDHLWNPSSTAPDPVLPPVVVRIYAVPGSLTIQVCDRGGGLSEKIKNAVWQYGFTTIDQQSGPRLSSGAGSADDQSTQAIMAMDQSSRETRFQLAGLGFGLPMSRLYARYFGGELTLVNIESFGVDAYISLPALDAHDWEEGSKTSSPAGIV